MAKRKPSERDRLLRLLSEPGPHYLLIPIRNQELCQLIADGLVLSEHDGYVWQGRRSVRLSLTDEGRAALKPAPSVVPSQEQEAGDGR